MSTHVIPPIAHFIWLGDRLPWAFQLAVHSALLNGGFDRVVLHHDGELSGSPGWDRFASVEGLSTRILDVPNLLGRVSPDGKLEQVYAKLNAQAARANVLRAAILAGEGGVYLDTDTITVRSLSDLRVGSGAFCGVERIVMPGSSADSRRVRDVLQRRARNAARKLCRALPSGWATFGHIAHLYPAAANNAVLGARPGHPLTQRLIEGMVAMPDARVRRQYALGTHLLQQVLRDADVGDTQVLPPATFYPLPPVISEHWFRPTRRIRLAEMITPETRVVHWYASGANANAVDRLDPEHVLANADRQPFSALALSTVQGRRFSDPIALPTLANSRPALGRAPA